VNDFDAKGLAARVAGLIHGQFSGDLTRAAIALDVDVDDLRRIVEDETDTPSLAVLGRIIRRFGVDACWLVTGEYDWQSHMRLLEDEDQEEDRDDRQLLLRLIGRRERGRENISRRIG
jgi:hypothetical protein